MQYTHSFVRLDACYDSMQHWPRQSQYLLHIMVALNVNSSGALIMILYLHFVASVMPTFFCEDACRSHFAGFDCFG